MLVSTTVVSTRIFAPGLKPFSLAMLTIRLWICLITSGPTATPHLPMVLASAILANPMRVNLR